MSEYTATYSPEDNKLRLYTVSRLDPATYARVSEAGFRWAPKQELFVAPAWTPHREDLLLALCEEIGDEDTSLVQRAEERADRFEDYSASRQRDAVSARNAVSAIADHIPFGQPILVGHHSERRARKDAERIENGMRRAVQMWDTSAYWKARAAGAVSTAKYKERPDVRARRIKGIEADQRKQARNLADSEANLQGWQREGLTMEQALHQANQSHLYRCFPLAQFPRQPPATQYEGSMGIWSALEGGVITAEQAQQICVPAFERAIAWAKRWLQHYENRLTYERAMLEEQGGLVADRFAVEVGGQVLVRGEWLIVKRVNRTGGKISSVSTNSRYVRVKSIEEVQDYRAPTAEQADAVKAATKLAPLANYPGEGFAHITQAEWDAIPTDYRTTKTIAATDTAARHRVRVALGCYVLKDEKDWNKRHGYPFVFITDAKQTPPAAAAATVAPTPELPPPEPVLRKPVQVEPDDEADQSKEFAAMRQQLRTGIAVEVVSTPQLFPTPSDLAQRMVDLADFAAGQSILEPSAGTAAIVRAITEAAEIDQAQLVTVELNRRLSSALALRYPKARHICADFLACSPDDLGPFDRILMNPPFANGQDIAHINQALRFLTPGGVLVALCANGPRQAEALLPLVKSHGGTWEELPRDTFKSAGTAVATVLLTIATK